MDERLPTDLIPIRITNDECGLCSLNFIWFLPVGAGRVIVLVTHVPVLFILTKFLGKKDHFQTT